MVETSRGTREGKSARVGSWPSGVNSWEFEEKYTGTPPEPTRHRPSHGDHHMDRVPDGRASSV